MERHNSQEVAVPTDLVEVVERYTALQEERRTALVAGHMGVAVVVVGRHSSVGVEERHSHLAHIAGVEVVDCCCCGTRT